MDSATDNRVQRHAGRRPRNKIAALPLALRRVVAAMLLDGETYDAVRAWLKGQGVEAARQPGNSAFAAYRAGAEFCELRDERLKIEGKHAQQRKLREALKAAGTIEDQTQVAIYATMEHVLAALNDPEADATKVLRSLTGVQKVLNETARLRTAQEKAATPVEEERRPLTGKELCDRVDELLGLRKPGGKAA